MAIYTTATELAEEITAWKAAARACADGQSYTIAGRSLTRADLKEIRRHLEWLDQQQEKLTSRAGGPVLLVGRPRR